MELLLSVIRVEEGVLGRFFENSGNAIAPGSALWYNCYWSLKGAQKKTKYLESVVLCLPLDLFRLSYGLPRIALFCDLL